MAGKYSRDDKISMWPGGPIGTIMDSEGDEDGGTVYLISYDATYGDRQMIWRREMEIVLATPEEVAAALSAFEDVRGTREAWED